MKIMNMLSLIGMMLFSFLKPGNDYGPNKNMAMLTQYSYKFTVPAHSNAHFTFQKNVGWVNDIIIYNGDMDPNWLAAKGDGYDMNAWDYANKSDQPYILYVTGWYKQAEPKQSDGVAWMQCSGYSNGDGKTTWIGFTDTPQKPSYQHIRTDITVSALK